MKLLLSALWNAIIIGCMVGAAFIGIGVIDAVDKHCKIVAGLYTSGAIVGTIVFVGMLIPFVLLHWRYKQSVDVIDLMTNVLSD